MTNKIMLKNIIAPMQAWLLFQGRCVGCGKPLPEKTGMGPLRPPGHEAIHDSSEASWVRVDCHCGRIYMYDPKSAKYRRATLDEIK